MLKRIQTVCVLALVTLCLGSCDTGGDACHDFAYDFCYEDSASDDNCPNTEGDARGSCYLTHSDGLCNYGSILAVNQVALDICYDETSDRTCDRFDTGFDVPASCEAAFIPGI